MAEITILSAPGAKRSADVAGLSILDAPPPKRIKHIVDSDESEEKYDDSSEYIPDKVAPITPVQSQTRPTLLQVTHSSSEPQAPEFKKKKGRPRKRPVDTLKTPEDAAVATPVMTVAKTFYTSASSSPPFVLAQRVQYKKPSIVQRIRYRPMTAQVSSQDQQQDDAAFVLSRADYLRRELSARYTAEDYYQALQLVDQAAALFLEPERQSEVTTKQFVDAATTLAQRTYVDNARRMACSSKVSATIPSNPLERFPLGNIPDLILGPSTSL